MTLSIRVLDSPAQIEHKILLACAREYNEVLRKRTPIIDKRVRAMTYNHFKNTDTFQSLSGGVLAGHFGFPATSAKQIAEGLLLAIVKSIVVTRKQFRISGTNISGGLTISIVKEDLSELLNFPGSTISVGGFTVPWVDWLLRKGDSIIITNFTFTARPGRGQSRQGIMTPSGQGWRVPPEHSGTTGNNWVTRTMFKDNNAYIKKVTQIVREEMYK
jgi:hypothetical protein